MMNLTQHIITWMTVFTFCLMTVRGTPVSEGFLFMTMFVVLYYILSHKKKEDDSQ